MMTLILLIVSPFITVFVGRGVLRSILYNWSYFFSVGLWFSPECEFTKYVQNFPFDFQGSGNFWLLLEQIWRPSARASGEFSNCIKETKMGFL